MLNTELERVVGVTVGTNVPTVEVVTRSHSDLVTKVTRLAPSKRKHARKPGYMVIRSGRPYFYCTVNKWNRRSKTIKTSKRYLGTSLPRGYYLST